MRVKYTLPARGALNVESDSPLTMGDWAFTFVKDDSTAFVAELVIEIANIKKEHWPTLTFVDQDPNAKIPRLPFATNDKVLHFGMIRSHVVNLESYLSVFGLEGFSFELLREEWIADPEDEKIGMQSGFELKGSKLTEVTKPLPAHFLSRCIAASKGSTEDTLFLAYFRMAQSNMFNRQYVDAIRYSYLCLEQLFAPEFSEKEKRFLDLWKRRNWSTRWMKRFSQELITFSNGRGCATRISDKVTAARILEFVIELRGQLQHAQKRSSRAWHPSEQRKYEDEATALFSLVTRICFTRTMRRLETVPTRSSAEGSSQSE